MSTHSMHARTDRTLPGAVAGKHVLLMQKPLQFMAPFAILVFGNMHCIFGGRTDQLILVLTFSAQPLKKKTVP